MRASTQRVTVLGKGEEWLTSIWKNLGLKSTEKVSLPRINTSSCQSLRYIDNLKQEFRFHSQEPDQRGKPGGFPLLTWKLSKETWGQSSQQPESLDSIPSSATKQLFPLGQLTSPPES